MGPERVRAEDSYEEAVAVAMVLSIGLLLLWLGNPFAMLLMVPAAHLCLLFALPGSRGRPALVAATVLAALLLPMLALLYYGSRFDLGLDISRYALLLVDRGRIALERAAHLRDRGQPAVAGRGRAGPARAGGRPGDHDSRAEDVRGPGLAWRDGVSRRGAGYNELSVDGSCIAARLAGRRFNRLLEVRTRYRQGRRKSSSGWTRMHRQSKMKCNMKCHELRDQISRSAYDVDPRQVAAAVIVKLAMCGESRRRRGEVVPAGERLRDTLIVEQPDGASVPDSRGPVVPIQVTDVPAPSAADSTSRLAFWEP